MGTKVQFAPIRLLEPEQRPDCTELAQRNPFPQDRLVRYEDGPHLYFIKSSTRPVPSVTKLTHRYCRTFDKERLSKQCSTKPNDPDYYDKTPEQILEIWEHDQKAGTTMHYYIECALNGRAYQRDCKEMYMFWSFSEDHYYLRIYRTELRIWNEELQLAGTVDALYEDLEEPGAFWLVDWKRCRKIRSEGFCNCWRAYRDDLRGYEYRHEAEICERFGPHPITADRQDCNKLHYTIQLNMYAYMLIKGNYVKRLKGMFLVVLNPRQDDYIKVPIQEEPELIKAIVEDRLQELSNMESLL